MKIKEKYYESVGEQVYFTRLSNGLTIHLIPKEDYYETYGIITTKFGSVDTRILVNGDERQVIFSQQLQKSLKIFNC